MSGDKEKSHQYSGGCSGAGSKLCSSTCWAVHKVTADGSFQQTRMKMLGKWNKIMKQKFFLHFFRFYLSRRRMKARAPPPPPQVPQPAPRQIFRSSTTGGGGVTGTDAKENILRPAVDLQLTLPGGYKTLITEDGRWEDAVSTLSRSLTQFLRNNSSTWSQTLWWISDGCIVSGSVWVPVQVGPLVGVSASTSTQALS